MTGEGADDSSDRRGADGHPGAVLRVPEVLMAVASTPGGAQLPDLVQALGLPKTSLHRILRTLESGGFLLREGQAWRCGPESLRLGRLLSGAGEVAGFPACARPEMERLARETGETVMLSELADGGRESVYLDVIESSSPLRFAMRPGNRRPLYAVASGKAMLAFQSEDARARYLAQTDFIRFTPETATRETLPAQLAEVAATGVVMDRNGIIDGASAIASPLFDAEGQAFAAISVAGPTERIERSRERIAALVREAGERLSRLTGFAGAYPPYAGSVSARR
ncbi:MAG TPA: IclR family transcriptional regulator [Novosphingobium sp.]|nr:IclR family transcriptional regulator [Novosphingobium sp.]